MFDIATWYDFFLIVFDGIKSRLKSEVPDLRGALCKPGS